MRRSVDVECPLALDMALTATFDLDTLALSKDDASSNIGLTPLLVAAGTATDTFLYVGVIRIHWCSTCGADKAEHRAGVVTHPGTFAHERAVSVLSVSPIVYKTIEKQFSEEVSHSHF